ncbi:Phosphopentomutase [Propionispora sp. 2/2-37]|uniref:phosphopentomutase n=1 Tax=Propionispora sp. 2/2-37 TaxID=1677858 RepID=UPI0006BB87FE|nr:Phosphopentomutase [Propionispora sp. 2/2-37]
MFNRIVVVVLDSVGIGALPDAGDYGDSTNVNTLVNIARSQSGLFLPVMESLGLGAIEPIQGVNRVVKPRASFGKMAELSKAKDTTSGHWEIAGCPVFSPFPVYPHGFPEDVIERFINYTGCGGVLGNKPASGTAIIEELGGLHMETGKPIVYTSADSVFQIAAHEEIVPLERLYQFCQIARDSVCIHQHAVGRIIARPFIGKPGSFKRTANRHDFSLEPVCPTILDSLQQAGYEVTGIGKIGDIFAQKGLTISLPSKSNDDGMKTVINLVSQKGQAGLIFANLVDFDSVYGHRNDVRGYAKALERFDGQLAILLSQLQEDDLLIITADHGCDPTDDGTDHTREYVPLLVYSKTADVGKNLGVRHTFADIAATVADNFSLSPLQYGKSFLHDL